MENALLALDATYKLHSVAGTTLNITLISRGQYLRVTPRAPSQVPHSLRTKKYYAATLAEARVRQELDVLREVRHPNILCPLDCPTSLLALDVVVCVTTLCSQDLSACFSARYAQEPAPADVVLKALWVLMSAIQYIHSKGVCHRRVCPRRILIDLRCTSCTVEWWNHLQLSGFKDGRRFAAEDMVGVVGERRYAAPEMLYRSAYCEKVDVWSAAASFASFLVPVNERHVPDATFRALLGLFARQTSVPPRIRAALKGSQSLQPVLQEALAECPRRRGSASSVCARLQTAHDGNKRRRCCTPQKDPPAVRWQEALARALAPITHQLSMCDIAAATVTLTEKQKDLVSACFRRLDEACGRLRVSITGPVAAAVLTMSDFTEKPEKVKSSPPRELQSRQTSMFEFLEHDFVDSEA